MTPDSSSSQSARCPNCGAALPEHALQGLCPKCLFASLAAATGESETAASQVPVQTPEELAPHFPQLEILECLGRGGMGVVYKARQKSLNRLVALKLLAPERAGEPEFAARFEKEAQALAALSHPNIVAVHDFGQAGGFFYLLMEFVDGVNLRQAMKAGRFTPEQALAVVPPVCEALQFAHEHGIVHRDIKPENLLLDKDGRVKIADFGIAKILGDESTSGPAEAQPAGTPQYMAPEQKGHQRTDHRADIYSLGVVLYEMLTGELPGAKLQSPSSRLRGLQIDVRLDEIVLRALEKSPELRYQTAAEMQTQVETVATTPAQAVPAPSAANRAPRWRGVLLFCGTLGLVVLAGNLVIALVLWLQTGQAWPLFQPRELPWVLILTAACFLMRMAALKLGAGRSLAAADASFGRKVLVVLLAIAVAVMALAGAGVLTWWVSRKTPAVALAEADRTAQSQIERVVVSNDQAVVKQRRYGGEGMMITFGTITHRWTPGGLYIETMFDVTLESLWFSRTGANWVIKARHGTSWNYRLDGPPGPMLGKIIFHPGTPAPEADGTYVIGEFRPETGAPLPLGVSLSGSGKQTASAATLDSWSPTLTPGEKVDPEKIRSEARDLMEHGRYEESLQRVLWYHHHALEVDPSYSGVRLSFALSDWTELARRYPKARDAMIETRDRATRAFAEGRGYFDLFMEVARLNERLHEEAATTALFKTIEQSDPALAKQCAIILESEAKRPAETKPSPDPAKR